MASNRRRTKELADLGTDHLEGCSVGTRAEYIYHWQAMPDGPAGTPYEGGMFEKQASLRGGSEYFDKARLTQVAYAPARTRP